MQWETVADGADFVKFIPFVKVVESDPTNNGRHTVYGLATAEIVDKEGEICDYDDAKKAYKAWSAQFYKATTEAGQEPSRGNVRVQHSMTVGGKVVQLDFDDAKKAIYVKSEPTAAMWEDIRNGLYTGYSQGGRYEYRKCDTCGTSIPRAGDFNCPKCDTQVKTRYGPRISEVSYVDNPALNEAVFTYVKRDGTTELRKITKHIERVYDPLENPDGNGQPLVTKADDDDDGKKPYGDVTYADPGYQEDKKKRYPIDTEAHIRAAWNYINKEKNAGMYSSSQVASIKSRIIAAWKKKIDKDGPPSAADKIDRAAEGLKQLGFLSRATERLDASTQELERAYLPVAANPLYPLYIEDPVWEAAYQAANEQGRLAAIATTQAYSLTGGVTHEAAAAAHNACANAYQALSLKAEQEHDTMGATETGLLAQYHRMRAAAHTVAARGQKLPQETMRLPFQMALDVLDLSKTMSAEIHDATRKIEQTLADLNDHGTELDKYSPDQERDERGRFGGRAGGSPQTDRMMAQTHAHAAQSHGEAARAHEYLASQKGPDAKAHATLASYHRRREAFHSQRSKTWGRIASRLHRKADGDVPNLDDAIRKLEETTAELR